MAEEVSAMRRAFPLDLSGACDESNRDVGGIGATVGDDDDFHLAPDWWRQRRCYTSTYLCG